MNNLQCVDTVTPTQNTVTPTQYGVYKNNIRLVLMSFFNSLQSLHYLSVYMDQSACGATLSKQSTYKVSTGMSSGTSYDYQHLQAIISYVMEAILSGDAGAGSHKMAFC